MEQTTGLMKLTLVRVLKDIHQDFITQFNIGNFFNSKYDIKVDSDDLRIILVSYQEALDSIIYWSIFPPDEELDELVKDMKISNGIGTVGYILRSKEPEVVNDTFDDPRGTISVEDKILQNYSWFGLPYFKDENRKQLSFIISFSYKKKGLWNLNKKDGNFGFIKAAQDVIKPFEVQLILLNEIKSREVLQNIFLKTTKDEDSILGKISRVAEIVTSYSYLTFEHDNKLAKIHLNNSLIVNKLMILLNWCEVMESKCDLCKGPSSYPNDITTKNCKYYTDFLNFIDPFEIYPLYLDKDKRFYLSFFYSGFEKIKDLDNSAVLDVFEQFTNIFKKDNPEKYLMEIITGICNLISDYIINNEENSTEKFKAQFALLIGSDRERWKNLKEPNDSFFASLDKIKEAFANKLLLIQFWLTKTDGISITKIVNNKIEINGFKEKLNEQICEYGTLNVLKRAAFDLDPDIPNTYKPLIASDSNRKLIVTHDKFRIYENDIIVYEIDWKKTKNFNQIYSIKLHPGNINRCFERLFPFTDNEPLKENYIFSYDERINLLEDFRITNLINPKIQIALLKENENEIKDNLKQYCQFIFETEEKRIANIQSAIAAIMARNMSHNIGSHVLTYIKQKLKDIPTHWQNNLFELNKLEGVPGKDLQLKISKEINDRLKINVTDKGEAPFLLGLSRFINYLQERQDFIATISTNYIPYSMSINFKDYIFDELNWDYRWIRYSRENVKEEINFEGKEINLLLDNIARSEDLYREHLHIFYNTFNGILDTGMENEASLKDLEKYEIDLPAGVVGRQALFSILENIIRNAAKHGKRNRKSKNAYVITERTIEKLCEIIPDSSISVIVNYLQNVAFSSREQIKSKLDYYLSIHDRLNYNTVKDRFDDILRIAEIPMIFTIKISEAEKIYGDELLEVKIYDNNRNANQSLNILLRGLTDKYINSDGSLKEENKGIKEMRISAAWLRNEIIAEIEDEQSSNGIPPILQITRVNDLGEEVKPPVYNEISKKFDEVLETREETNLCFKFYLRKPHRVICITPTPASQLPVTDKNVWEFITPENYLFKRSHNYKLILIDETLKGNSLEELEKYSPSRILHVKIEDIIIDLKLLDDLDDLRKDEYLKEVYYKYYKKWFIETSKKKHNLLKLVKNNKLTDEIEIPEILVIYDSSFKGGNDTSFQSGNKHIKLRREIDDRPEIVFRTHNDTLAEFNIFKNELGAKFETLKFVEGISGNNSTVRMMQLEDKSEEWIYKVIESALTTVLIIDERLHKKYSCQKQDPHSCKNDIFHKKNIHIINIHIPEEEIDLDSEKPIKFEIKDLCNRTIGNISFDNESPDVELVNLMPTNFQDRFDQSKKILTYDFVLLHQGIVDKLCGKDSGKDQTAIKFEKIQLALKEKIKCNFHYIIHSGRSQPFGTENNKFILYSAIDKAVDDCKVALCNILYSAYIQKKQKS